MFDSTKTSDPPMQRNHPPFRERGFVFASGHPRSPGGGGCALHTLTPRSRYRSLCMYVCEMQRSIIGQESQEGGAANTFEEPPKAYDRVLAHVVVLILQ